MGKDPPEYRSTQYIHTMINISSSKASSLVWELQKIQRCLDLSFLFKGEGEIWVKVTEAQDCIEEAVHEMNYAANAINEIARAEAVAKCLKALEFCDGAITEALSVASPYHREQGALANLRAGRKAIIELHSSITK